MIAVLLFAAVLVLLWIGFALGYHAGRRTPAIHPLARVTDVGTTPSHLTSNKRSTSL